MLTPGHIAASYLIASGAKSLGFSISSSEIWQVIIAGNVMDIDFIIGQFTGKTGEAHHQNTTHSPLGALLILPILWLIFHPTMPIVALFLIALLVHLILDDIGYWMYKLRFYKTPTNPQVNWLYPITKFHKNKLITGNINVLNFYLFKAWPVATLELILTLAALLLYFLTR